MESEILLLKQAMLSLASIDPLIASKTKVAEPKPLYGAQNAQELENFPWDMVQYFKAIHPQEKNRVYIATMFPDPDW